MIESGANMTGRLSEAGKPARAFGVLSLIMLGIIVAVSQGLYGDFAVPAVIFVVISGIALRGLISGYPHNLLGACNVVTLGRAALVSVLAGAVFAPVSPWAVCAIGLCAFALDGVDGWLARRSHLSSDFGARFDMEVDALLGAVLTLVLLAEGVLGAEVLILGFSRYVFLAAGTLWPVLKGPLPYSFRRRAICVVQIAALIVLMFPLTPAAVLGPVAVFGGAALVYSFGVDIIYLVRRRV
jgi:phosphatidylglycerophosphate synthase